MKNIGKIILLVLGVALIALGVKVFAELPGQKAAILSYIDPLVAVLISVTILNETMTMSQVFGGTLILGFTLWNELSPKLEG